MSQQFRYPSTAQVSIPAIGPNGVLIPSQSILIAGEGPTNLLTPLSVEADGSLNVNIVSTTPNPLPVTDAALDASIAPKNDPSPANVLQIGVVDIGGNIKPINEGQAIADESLPVVIASNQTDLPMNLTQVSGAAIALGAQLAAAGLPVSLATDQLSTLATEATVATLATEATVATLATEITLQNVDTTLNSIAAIVGTDGNPPPVSVAVVAGFDGTNVQSLRTDASGELQVDIASSVLPTGAATLAEQLVQSASLANIEADVALIQAQLPAALGQATMAASLAVVVASDQSPIDVNIDSITGPLQVVGNVAAGAADAGNPVKVGGRYNASLPTLSDGQRGDMQLDASSRQIIAPLTNASVVKAQLQDNAGTAIVLGQTTASASVPVVLASNQPALPGPAGRARANAPALNNYGSTPVTSSAYVTLIASTAADANMIEIFDSSGQSLFLAVGAASSEVDQFIIFPGGNGQVPLAIPAGSRISLKATSTTANAGFIVANLYT